MDASDLGKSTTTKDMIASDIQRREFQKSKFSQGQLSQIDGGFQGTTDSFFNTKTLGYNLLGSSPTKHKNKTHTNETFKRLGQQERMYKTVS
jgi:hypothetical protein